MDPEAMTRKDYDELCRDCRRMSDHLEMGADGQIHEVCPECIVTRTRQKREQAG